MGTMRVHKAQTEGPTSRSQASRPLCSVLLKSGLLAADKLDAAVATSELQGRPLWDVVLNDLKLPEEAFADAIAAQARIPHIRLAAVNIDPEAVARLPEDLAGRHVCIPLKVEHRRRSGEGSPGSRTAGRGSLVLAMVNPTDLDTIHDLEFFVGLALQPMVATLTEIKDAIGHFYSPEKSMHEFLRDVPGNEEIQIKAEEISEAVDPTAEHARQAPAVKMVNLILQQAIKQGVSDIHVEPNLNVVQIRTRQEGLLREFLTVPKWIHEPLVSRMKILAKLDISDRRRPQDGRIKVTLGKKEVDLRVSTLPTHFGEKVVLRVLGSGHGIPSTSDMGLKPKELEAVRQAVSQPQGLVLVTGPTGSGKTTTLYSFINERKDPTVNITTVEDPIEFQLPGINQVQVNSKTGLSFAACLRSILRQDPDVILVGEIRDLETAEIAFHAAMTGHLVISTLHTNSTLATIGRLLDLGIDPYFISAAVNLIVAQRLVRKICPSCKTEHHPEAADLARLHLEDANFPFFKGAGCEHCGQTGYAGRVGIFEMLRITPTLKRLINRKAPEAELRKAAEMSGAGFLLPEALARVREGVTTIEEVFRVVQLQEEEGILCPQCAGAIHPDFSVCPFCLYSLRRICEGCKQDLKPEWRLCPYCATASAAPASAPAKAPEPQRGHGLAEVQRPKILVVDDDNVCRTLALGALKKLDLDPELYAEASGPDGLRAVEEHKPDMIILDVMMPGMSGFEVCKKLRSNLQTAFIPILMLTANVDEASRTDGFVAGTDDYMGKPFSVPELHARVKRLLRRTYGV